MPNNVDTLSLARAMNKDFAKKTKELFDPEVAAVEEAISTGMVIIFSIISIKILRYSTNRT